MINNSHGINFIFEYLSVYFSFLLWYLPFQSIYIYILVIYLCLFVKDRGIIHTISLTISIFILFFTSSLFSFIILFFSHQIRRVNKWKAFQRNLFKWIYFTHLFLFSLSVCLSFFLCMFWIHLFDVIIRCWIIWVLCLFSSRYRALCSLWAG